MISATRWWVWASVTGAWFLRYEIPAIKNAYDGDTLSEYVFGMGPWRFVIVAFLVWLVAHFWTKGKV